MLKHLKLFEEHSQYEEYVGGGGDDSPKRKLLQRPNGCCTL